MLGVEMKSAQRAKTNLRVTDMASTDEKPFDGLLCGNKAISPGR